MPDLNPQKAFTLARLARYKFYYTYDKARKDLGHTPKPLSESMKRIGESLNRSA